MPLQKSIGSDYVQSEIICIDSSIDAVEGSTKDRFKIKLNKMFSNVIALEITEFHFPKTMVSPFLNANKIDFRLKNPAIFGGNWKTFVAIIPVRDATYASSQETSEDLLSILYRTFEATIIVDPDFGAKVRVGFQLDPFERTDMFCFTNVFPPIATWPGSGTTEMELLFGTGVNKSESAALPLGFEPVDTLLPASKFSGVDVKRIVSTRPTNLGKFTYVDIEIEQVDEFKPHTRAYVPAFKTDKTVAQSFSIRPRLLTKPIRLLTDLTFNFFLRDRTRPTNDQPLFLKLEVFYLDRTLNIPNYAIDKFQSL